MKREIVLGDFEAKVAGLPRLRWEALALVKEVKGKEPEYLRTWVRVACPECRADLKMTSAGKGTELACVECSYRSVCPKVKMPRVVRAVMRKFGLP